MNQTGSEISSDEDWQETVPILSYLLVFVAWWREIALSTVLVAVVAWALPLALLALLPQYETSADVVIIPRVTSVSLDDRLRTDPDSIRPRPRDMAARRAALVGLVHNGNVARSVIDRMKERFGELDEDEIGDSRILEKIESELVAIGTLTARNSSDLIRIRARAASPEKAAFLASSWSEEYVKHVNRVYQQAPAAVLSGVTAEREQARAQYATAQRALEDFVSKNRLPELERKIAMKKKISAEVQDAWASTVEKRLLDWNSRETIRSFSIELPETALKNKIEADYLLYLNLIHLLQDTLDFRSQLEGSEEANDFSNRITLLMIKAAAYARTSPVFSKLEIRLDDFTTDASGPDAIRDNVDAIISTIKARIEKLRTDLTSIIHHPEKYVPNSKHSVLSDNNTTPTAVFEKNQRPSPLEEINVEEIVEMESALSDENVTSGPLSIVAKMEKDLQDFICAASKS